MGDRVLWDDVPASQRSLYSRHKPVIDCPYAIASRVAKTLKYGRCHRFSSPGSDACSQHLSPDEISARSAARTARGQRRMAAYQMKYAEGRRFKEIGEWLGISRQRARQLVIRAAEDIRRDQEAAASLVASPIAMGAPIS